MSDQTIFPALRYRDAPVAIEWLGRAFGFEPRMVVDAHHERAVGAGAEIVRALADTDYGSREYSARDPEGNVWSFGSYRPGAS
jgi:uncharacterized glyoxalase superfamily protein PhnB